MGGMLAVLITVRGRVQGVGFRYSVKQIAAGFEVTGEIRNLPDGRVELRVGGECAEVAAFLRAVRDSHLRHHIEAEPQQAIAHDPAARGFVIAH